MAAKLFDMSKCGSTVEIGEDGNLVFGDGSKVTGMLVLTPAQKEAVFQALDTEESDSPEDLLDEDEDEDEDLEDDDESDEEEDEDDDS